MFVSAFASATSAGKHTSAHSHHSPRMTITYSPDCQVPLPPDVNQSNRGDINVEDSGSQSSNSLKTWFFRGVEEHVFAKALETGNLFFQLLLVDEQALFPPLRQPRNWSRCCRCYVEMVEVQTINVLLRQKLDIRG